MKKKTKIIISVTIVFFLFAMFFYLNGIKNTENKEPTLIISNNTNKSIDGLKVRYTTSNKEIEIPQIKPNKSYNYIISTDADDSINLIYTDQLGNQQKKLITSYITKGITDTFKMNIEATASGDIIFTTNN